MAWLSRVNFVSSDTLSFTDVNNLGNDIRAWGDNVNGGGYTLSNVVLSASSGTMATVTGGAGAASTLTLRSTSGAGTTDAIVFQTGSQAEAMRIASSRNVGIGTATPATRLHVFTNQPTAANEVARFQGGNNSSNFRNYISCFSTNPNFWWELSNQDSAGTGSTNGFAFRERSDADPSVVRLYLASGGNVGIGTSSPGRLLDVRGLSAFSDGTQGFIVGPYTGGIGYGAIYRFGTTPDGSNYVFGANATATIVNSPTQVVFAIAGLEKSRLESTGNLKIGGTADRATTVGTNQVVIFNGTAPVGTLANGCSFYSTAGEMRVMDAAGNATLLSPHDSQTNEWIYDSSHTPTGKRLKIDVERLLRFLNDHFGLDCVHDFIEEN